MTFALLLYLDAKFPDFKPGDVYWGAFFIDASFYAMLGQIFT